MFHTNRYKLCSGMKSAAKNSTSGQHLSLIDHNFTHTHMQAKLTLLMRCFLIKYVCTCSYTHPRSQSDSHHHHHHHLEASILPSKCSHGIFNIEQADAFACLLNPKAHMGPQDHLQSVNKHVHIHYYHIWNQFITVYVESERKGRQKHHYLSIQDRLWALRDF